jgi:pyruvate dehydrogenase E1 component
MTNLGGHDLPSLLRAFEAAREHDRPVCFIAYTIKGFGLPLAGHKDNHAGLMTPAQMDELRRADGIRDGHEWEPFEGLGVPEARLRAFLDKVPFARGESRRLHAQRLAVPASLALPHQPVLSSQQAFGLILNALASSGEPIADRIVTSSPDVTVSTNLGPWVNRRGLFARQKIADRFRTEKIPSTFRWDRAPTGQHLELGIAEMNLFILLGALGLSHSLFGERVIPIGTLYDPFIARGLDALNYACYQDARFLIVGTPSGISLAPEGGAHQSIMTPLIGMAQDGLCAFEPAFADELAVIMRFAFDYMQRDGADVPDDTTWLRDAAGGAVYLRLSTRAIEQPKRAMSPQLDRAIVDGAYWLREPGPNPEIIVAYQGVVAPEAIEAVGLMGEDRRDVGLLAVTSADRLYAGWAAAQAAREAGHPHALSHIERLLGPVPRNCALVTVIDGHPATLGWLGAVAGHRVRSLGVDTFGQVGSIPELYRHYGIDRDAIIGAAAAIAPGRPIRYAAARG